MITRTIFSYPRESRVKFDRRWKYDWSDVFWCVSNLKKKQKKNKKNEESNARATESRVRYTVSTLFHAHQPRERLENFRGRREEISSRFFPGCSHLRSWRRLWSRALEGLSARHKDERDREHGDKRGRRQVEEGEGKKRGCHDDIRRKRYGMARWLFVNIMKLPGNLRSAARRPRLAPVGRLKYLEMDLAFSLVAKALDLAADNTRVLRFQILHRSRARLRPPREFRSSKELHSRYVWWFSHSRRSGLWARFLSISQRGKGI